MGNNNCTFIAFIAVHGRPKCISVCMLVSTSRKTQRNQKKQNKKKNCTQQYLIDVETELWLQKWQRAKLHASTTVIQYRCHLTKQTETVWNCSQPYKSTSIVRNLFWWLSKLKWNLDQFFRWWYAIKLCTMKNKFMLPWFRLRQFRIVASTFEGKLTISMWLWCFEKNRTWNMLLICPLTIANTITRCSNQISLH